MDINKFIKLLQEEIKESKESIEKTESLLRLQEAAARYNGEDRIVTFEEIASRVRKRGPIEKYSTGFKKLDELLKGGFRKKQVVVLSAIHKHGKTSMCLFWNKQLEILNPLWIPLEQPA